MTPVAYWYQRGYDGTVSQEQGRRKFPSSDTRQQIQRQEYNSVKDDDDPQLGVPRLTLMKETLRSGEDLGNRPPVFVNLCREPGVASIYMPAGRPGPTCTCGAFTVRVVPVVSG